MGDKKAGPPKLPGKAPKDLKDFVGCKRLTVELDLTANDWLPSVPVFGKPKVTATATGADKADLTIGGEYVKFKLPVSVSSGQLKVDTSEVPDLGGMKSGVDNWVKQLNDSMKDNSKELEHIEVKNGKVVLTKKVVAAAAPVKDGATTTPATPEGKKDPPKDAPKGGLKLGPAKVAVGVTAIALLGVGAVVLTRDDDGGTTDAVQPVDSPAPGDEDGNAGGGVTNNTDGLDDVLCGAGPGTVFAPGGVVWGPGIDAPCSGVPPAWPVLSPQPGPPFEVMVDPVVAISHDGSVPDVITGMTGPSQASYRVFVALPHDGMVRVAAECGGQELTGESAVAADGPTTVAHPLFEYGPCSVTELTVTDDVLREMWRVADPVPPFEVGPDPVDPGTTPLVPVVGAMPESSYVVLSTLANRWLEPGCVAAVDASATVAGAGPCVTSLGGEWTYTAIPSPSGTVLVGGGMLTVDGSWPDGDLANELFDRAVFPCGPGQVAVTACSDGASPVGNDFAVVTVVLPAPLPAQPTADAAPVQLELASSGQLGAKDASTFRLDDEGGQWVVQVPDGAAATGTRAILRDDSVTFVVPSGELPAGELEYRVTLGDGDDAVKMTEPILGQLAAQAPASDTSTPTSSSTPVEPETPETFFAAVSASLASGDVTFALERLHPAVLDTYSEDTCRAALEARSQPGYEIAVVSVGGTGPFTYTPPNAPPIDVGDALTVTVTVTGVDGEVEGHIALVDGTYRWFTVCT